LEEVKKPSGMQKTEYRLYSMYVAESTLTGMEGAQPPRQARIKTGDYGQD
jgi:hypothetical protein